MFWERRNIEKKNGIIELCENGFQVTQNNVVSIIEWLSIDKINAFKVDLLTSDEICLEIDYLDKRILITEECIGWRIFVSELINRIPTIDSEWEGKIMRPAFDRNETEMFDRN